MTTKKEDKRERKEENFRNINSKNGSYSVHIGKTTAERLKEYCRLTNKNKKKFVEECINKQLEVCEKDYYQSLTKEELVELLTSH